MKHNSNESKQKAVKLLALAKCDSKKVAYHFVQFYDFDGKPRRALMPSTAIVSLGKIKEFLINRGYPAILNTNHWAEVQQNLDAQTNHRIYISPRPGFVNNTYLCANGKVVGKQSKYGPILNPASQIRPPRESTQGNLEQWQNMVSRFVPHSPVLALSVCAAFSGILAHLVDIECGGFHFYGPSSIGKSSCLAFAASVCGGTDFVQSWGTTDKAFEELAEGHNNNILVLDELKLLHEDPRTGARLAAIRIYRLSEGQGKIRSKDYQSQQSSWHLAIISAGEQSLLEHAGAGGVAKLDGERVRMVDVPADAGTGYGIFESLPSGFSSIELTEELTGCLSNSYGVAKIAFLERLTKYLHEDKQSVTSFLDKHIKLFERRNKITQMTGQESRITKRFAFTYAAGALAKKCGILPEFRYGTAISKCLKSIESKERKIESICNGIFEKLNSQSFRELSYFEPKIGYQKFDKANGFITFVKGQKVIALRREYLKSIVNNAALSMDVLKHLSRIGKLKTDSANRLSRTLRLPTGRSERFYCLTVGD